MNRSATTIRAATIGMFDGVHRGHQFLIANLLQANTSPLPPIAVTFADHPLALLDSTKAPRLITTATEKSKLLTQLHTEPIILDFDRNLASTSAASFMAMLQQRFGINRLLLGFNNRFGHDRPVALADYQAIGMRLGIDVIEVPELHGEAVSSSMVRQAIDQGNIKHANDMLERKFTLTGIVTHGQHIGHTIGFPTANIALPSPRLIIPATGVYACDVKLPDGSTHRAAVNIGYRPTVDHSKEPRLSIEAHIINFDGDLYGKEISIEFIDKIRDERRMPDIDTLQHQLKADVTAAIALQQ